MTVWIYLQDKAQIQFLDNSDSVHFSMRYVAAYLLASLGSKSSPTAADIEKILGSVGIECEKDKVSKVISELKGKNLEEVIEEGQYPSCI